MPKTLVNLATDVLFLILKVVVGNRSFPTVSSFLQFVSLHRTLHDIYKHHLRTFIPLLFTKYIPRRFYSPAILLTLFTSYPRQRMKLAQAKRELVHVSNGMVNVALGSVFRTHQVISAIAYKTSAKARLHVRLYGHNDVVPV